jgi:hypothetical protein
VNDVGVSDTNPFRTEQQGDRYRVEDGTGRCMLECRDRASADHYVDLLNKAYASGYRAGYRAGKG